MALGVTMKKSERGERPRSVYWVREHRKKVNENWGERPTAGSSRTSGAVGRQQRQRNVLTGRAPDMVFDRGGNFAPWGEGHFRASRTAPRVKIRYLTGRGATGAQMPARRQGAAESARPASLRLPDGTPFHAEPHSAVDKGRFVSDVRQSKCTRIRRTQLMMSWG